MNMENTKGIIYRAYNTITGESYIGRTTNGLIKRRKAHLVSSNKEAYTLVPFHRNIKEYGAINFIWEILEYVKISMLNMKETEYIIKYDSYNNGLNSKRGSGMTDLKTHKFNGTLYNFNNKDGTEELNVSINYMSTKYNIKYKYLHLLVNNRKKSTAGWYLV